MSVQAGEDLEEDDDDDDEDDDLLATAAAEAGASGHVRISRDVSVGERAPLLRGRSKSRHRRQRSGPPTGSATVTQAVLMVS